MVDQPIREDREIQTYVEASPLLERPIKRLGAEHSWSVQHSLVDHSPPLVDALTPTSPYSSGCRRALLTTLSVMAGEMHH